MLFKKFYYLLKCIEFLCVYVLFYFNVLSIYIYLGIYLVIVIFL